MMKFSSSLLLLALLLSSCYSNKKAVQSSRPFSEQINWPEAYKPSEASFFVHNQIDIKAAPMTVWDILIQAESWPDWYEGAANVKVQNAANGVLTKDAVFNWKTMGLDFESTIQEFIPPLRLSWESRKKSIRGYHAWLIIPTKDGCQLITDESQHGWITFMEKTFQPQKLRKLHDIWLQKIKMKAEAATSARE